MKQKIYNHFLGKLDAKIIQLEAKLADLKESGSNETKSTAGDKHETALAMLQIEQANVRKQMDEALQQRAVMFKIDPAIAAVHIVNGSLVKTNKGYYFICIAAGKGKVDGIDVTAISSQSPLGNKLIGSGVGDRITINENIFVIESFQ
ncbi:MAG: hypothetical protein ABIY51_04575 [Ferruginibacter sp.]